MAFLGGILFLLEHDDLVNKYTFIVFITKFHWESGFLKGFHGLPLGTNGREITWSLKF